MKRKYIQDPETHKLVPAEEYARKERSGVQIMSDISPYRSIIDGSVITSRSRHREHLKRHGCIEVGDQKQF